MSDTSICRLLGVHRLILYALNEWLQDLKKNQLPSILGGVGPMYSLVQLGMCCHHYEFLLDPAHTGRRNRSAFKSCIINVRCADSSIHNEFLGGCSLLFARFCVSGVLKWRLTNFSRELSARDQRFKLSLFCFSARYPRLVLAACGAVQEGRTHCARLTERSSFLHHINSNGGIGAHQQTRADCSGTIFPAISLLWCRT